MRWITGVAAALLVIGLSTTDVSAQTITLKSVDTSTAKQITVNADVANIPAGWTVKSVTMLAPPTGGAAGGGGMRLGADSGGGVWAGTMTGLTSGNEYDVQALVLVFDDNSDPHFYYSAKQKAKVK